MAGTGTVTLVPWSALVANSRSSSACAQSGVPREARPRLSRGFAALRVSPCLKLTPTAPQARGRRMGCKSASTLHQHRALVIEGFLQHLSHGPCLRNALVDLR